MSGPESLRAQISCFGSAEKRLSNHRGPREAYCSCHLWSTYCVQHTALTSLNLHKSVRNGIIIMPILQTEEMRF